MLAPMLGLIVSAREKGALIPGSFLVSTALIFGFPSFSGTFPWTFYRLYKAVPFLLLILKGLIFPRGFSSGSMFREV